VPRADTTWAEGKDGYKALQYMACGVATVAAGLPWWCRASRLCWRGWGRAGPPHRVTCA